MPPIEIPQQTLWQLDVCNACRYCEGYCAVFSALSKRRRVTPHDVIYLANLCHDCRACFYACMYAPPHEFGVNIPKTLADVRQQTYAAYALPRIAAHLGRRNLALLALSSLAGLVLYLGLAVASGPPERLLAVHVGPGAFYAVVPYLAMMLPALLVSVYALGSLLAGAFAFARDSGAPTGGARGAGRARYTAGHYLGALWESLTLRYLRGGTAGGCTYPAERPSNARLVLHMLVFYGFLSAFAATVSAFFMQDLFGLLPPYPLLSPPVVLGSLGGVGLIVGATGLLVLKARSDRDPADQLMLDLDWLFLISLDVVSITGMLTLVLRETAAMGTLLVIHLASVLALYVSLPYGKFAHFAYRYAALVRNRLESR